MPPSEFPKSAWLRTVIASFFILSGAFMSLMTVAGWGLLYVCCSALWLICGFVWLVRPSFAARLNAFPVLTIVVLIAALFLPPYKKPVEPDPIFWLYGLQVFSAATALALVVTTIRKTTVRKRTPILISFGLVLAAFVVDKAAVNKTELRTYSMNWTADGTAPWGHADFGERDGPPVVLYRRYGQGYCFDVFYSPELRRKLIESNQPLVNVEYGVTSDFGRERGYNVRSVDGLVFTDKKDRQVRPGEGPGGYAGAGSGSCYHKVERQSEKK
jgi:hypothetical protein